MNTTTEKQASFIRSLVAKIEAHKPVAPKKVSKWIDPVRAHAGHVRYAREVLALLDAGELTRGGASTHIDTLVFKAKAY